MGRKSKKKASGVAPVAKQDDICIRCKRNAFYICAICEVLGLSDSCWACWDMTIGLRHHHCEYGVPPIASFRHNSKGKKNQRK